MHNKKENQPPAKAAETNGHDNDNQEKRDGDYDPMDLTSPEWQAKFAAIRKKYAKG